MPGKPQIKSAKILVNYSSCKFDPPCCSRNKLWFWQYFGTDVEVYTVKKGTFFSTLAGYGFTYDG